MSLIQNAERHPVTTILVVGAVATTLADATGRSVAHLVLTPWTAMTEPWRFVTTIFPHGGTLHLLFNVLWTIRLGSAIEARLGTLRMLALALVTSVVAAACEVSLYNAGIGLSGAVFGFAFYAYARGKHDPRFHGVVTRQDLGFFVAWFVFCVVATQMGVLLIANAAHGGGAVIGYLLGVRRPWIAPAFVAAVGFFAFGRLSGLAPRLPENERLRDGAEAAIVYEEPERALRLYEQIFDSGERRLIDRYNYGVALQNAGRVDEAYREWVAIYRQDPELFENPEHRAIVAERAAELDGAVEEERADDDG